MKRWIIGILAVLAVLLVVGLLAGPPIAARIIRGVLATAPGYDTSLEGVALRPFRGEAVLHGITFRRAGGTIEEPFLAVDRITVRPVIGAWLRGDRVADVAIEGLVVNVVIGPNEAESQTEIDADWLVPTIEKFPATVDRLVVRGGTITYADTAASPAVKLVVHDLEVDGTNLANRAQSAEELFATVDVRGRVMESGALTAHVAVDPYADAPRFDLASELSSLQMTELNDALRAYGNFDVAAGTFAVTTNIEAKDGAFSGTATPKATDLKIHSPEDRNDKLPQRALEAVVGVARTVGEILTPGPKDQIRADVPIRGEFGDTPALLAMLRVLPDAWFGSLKHAAGEGLEAGREAAEGAEGVQDAVEPERADRDAKTDRALKKARREEKKGG